MEGVITRNKRQNLDVELVTLENEQISKRVKKSKLVKAALVPVSPHFIIPDYQPLRKTISNKNVKQCCFCGGSSIKLENFIIFDQDKHWYLKKIETNKKLNSTDPLLLHVACYITYCNPLLETGICEFSKDILSEGDTEFIRKLFLKLKKRSHSTISGNQHMYNIFSRRAEDTSSDLMPNSKPSFLTVSEWDYFCQFILQCYNALRLENIENYIAIGSSFLHFQPNFSKQCDGQQILHLDGNFESWHENSIVFICPVSLDEPNWRIVPTNIVPDLPFKWKIDKLETLEQAFDLYDVKYFYTSAPKRALCCEPKRPAFFLGRKIHAAGSVPNGCSKANLFIYFSKSVKQLNDLDATFPATSFISREENYNEFDQVATEIENWSKLVPKVAFHTRENEKLIDSELKMLRQKRKYLSDNEIEVKQQLYEQEQMKLDEEIKNVELDLFQTKEYNKRLKKCESNLMTVSK